MNKINQLKKILFKQFKFIKKTYKTNSECILDIVFLEQKNLRGTFYYIFKPFD